MSIDTQELKEIVDIKTVLDKYPIEKEYDEGEEIVGLCPFHDDTTPSFSFNKNLKLFNCFGCGTKGDVITYVMLRHNCSFKQAIDELADMMHVELSNNSSKPTRNKPINNKHKVATPLSDKEKEFLKFTQKNKNKIVQSPYWRAAKFPYKVITFFELGYYNNRIFIPIKDVDNVLVGFSSRSAEVSPDRFRYVHKKGFIKSSVLYNLNTVVNSKKKNHESIIITEGFSDVWGAFSNGYPECVAIMGKIITDEQIKLLSKYTNKVCLAFDGDSSGIAGMKDFIKRTKNLMSIDLMKIPKNRDLGSLNYNEFWGIFSERIKL